MKRVFWLVAVLALLGAGCGGAADEGESEGEGGSAEVQSGPGFDGKTIKLGVLIVAFLIFEPRGLAAIWLRIKAYFKSWPFSY